MIKRRIGLATANFAVVAMMASALTTHLAWAQPNAGADQVQIDQGKVTFAQKCSHCHGRNMVSAGTIAPDLRSFPDDKQRFVATVKLGKSNKMPPWGDLLDDDQIGSLWAYVSSQRKP